MSFPPPALSSAFPDHAAFQGVCPKSQTKAQAAHYWDAAPNAEGFAGTSDYGMETGGWTCPLDVGSTLPAASRLDTCGVNNHGPPSRTRNTGGAGKRAAEAEAEAEADAGGAGSGAPPQQARNENENPYAKVLSGACWARIWKKLLDLPVSSLAFPKQCVALHRVLGHYADETKASIAIGLMNEPNMVDTADLARAYKKVVTLIRKAPYALTNRLLIMGNYWGGLHAQVTPEDRSNATTCGAPAATSEGRTVGGKMPLEVIHKALVSLLV